MLEGIEHIILDLGGVIINLNHELTYSAFRQLFPYHHQEIHNKLSVLQLVEKYETNQVSTHEFIQYFKGFNSSVSDDQIIEAWNKMLLDIPLERIRLIERISKKYQVYLLSNTNELHYDAIEKYYQKLTRNSTFKSLFKESYLSYQVGLRKPNPEIFQYLIRDAQLKPENTLFIDDSMEHINSALTLNINAQHLNLNQHQSLISLFDGY